MALGTGIVVVGPSMLANVHRYVPTAWPLPADADIGRHLEAMRGLTHDIYVGMFDHFKKPAFPTLSQALAHARSGDRIIFAADRRFEAIPVVTSPFRLVGL